jgi:hypothetical protein
MTTHGITKFCIAGLLSLVVGCADREAEAEKLHNDALTHESQERHEEALAIHRRVVVEYADTVAASWSGERVVFLEQLIENAKRVRPTSMSYRPPSKYLTGAALTKHCAKTFRESLDGFRADVGRYPTTREGLRALVRNPGVPGYGGPEGVSYLKPGFLRNCEKATSQVRGGGFAYESYSDTRYTLVIE